MLLSPGKNGLTSLNKEVRVSLVILGEELLLLKFVFSVFPRISWVRSEQKILGEFEVFP